MKKEESALCKSIKQSIEYLVPDVPEFRIPSAGLIDSICEGIDVLCRSERRIALQDAAKAVCLYCGERALDYDKIPVGPNEASNYVHYSKSAISANVLCKATAIHHILRCEMVEK